MRETTIDNVRSHLLGFVDKGQLTLKRYNDTDTSAEADAELLPTFVHLYAHGGDKVLAHVTRYYPHLVNQMVAGQK